MKDFYRILEVHPEAGTEVVTQAYKTLVKKYHPDCYHVSDKRLLNERMQAINEAYATLGDPVRRARYDEHYHNYMTTKPQLERQAQRQARLRNFVYFFLLAILIGLLFRGFVAVLLTNPLARLIIIGLAILVIIRLWKR